MSDEQTLKDVMLKAHIGGCTKYDNYRVMSIEDQAFIYDTTTPIHRIEPPDFMIFDREFAKAVWGEEWPTNSANSTTLFFAYWQYHIRDMVIAEDRIGYLRENAL